MRRSLPVASVVALVATLLTASPAAAQDLGRQQVPIPREPTDSVAADAVIAPVSDDAHPVTPEVEIVGFGAEPAEGTPEAEASDAVDGESGEPEATEPAEPETEPAEPESTEPAEPDSESVDSTDSESVDGDEISEDAQSLGSIATTSFSSTSRAVTDAPSGDDETESQQSDEPSDVEAPEEVPSDEPTSEAPSEDPSDDVSPEEPASEESSREEPSGEETHEHHEDDGHDHDHDSSGEGLSTQLYASAETPELSVLGVTWDLGSAPADLVVEVRTRTDEEWTEWEALHVEATETRDDEAEVVEARDGTMPMALIDVDAVEVRLASDTELPTAPSLAVVDPGESTADSASVTSATTMSTNATARPTIYSRAQWGADERMMTWTPSQGRVQGIDIHHTVNANNYTQAQVPALMRSIYAYHAQDWGRGWGDIGYNFIVDRFGRIWEGRAGGVDQAPTGAHATGLNSNFSGISLLGNFDTVAVPAAAFTSVARLAAWKLAMHGITTSGGTVTVEAGTFNRINGHRDSKQTTCPGRYMYNRLGEMRTRINSYIGSFADRQLDRDLDGDGYADLVLRTGNDVSLVSTVDRGVLSFVDRGSNWSPTRTASAGDVNGDGYDDLYMIRPDGKLYLYPGTSTGTFPASARQVIFTGWGSITAIAGGVDWNGDGRPDLFQRRSDGSVWLYLGTATGKLASGTRVATSGWGAMASMSIAPRFVGGKPALLALNGSTGRLHAYQRSSTGGIGSPIALGTGIWSGARFVAGTPNVTGSNFGDVVVMQSSGALWLVAGTGTGTVNLSSRTPLGSVPADARLVLPHSRASGLLGFNLVRADSVHSMRRYTFRETHAAYTDPRPTGLTLAVTDRLVIAVGDWNRDGRGDLAVLKGDGRLMLHLGTGNGRFQQSGRQLISGWTTYRYGIVGAGDLRGDGSSGVVAWDRTDGRLWYYASDGSHGIRPKVLVSNGASGMDMLVNAGFWNGVGTPDFLMRGASSAGLFRYEGNGPGLALPPVSFSSGWGWMNSIVGVADVTWDGKPDLVTVNTNGRVTVYAGTGTGSLSRWADVGSLPSDGKVS